MGENLKITFWRESGLSSAGPTLASAGTNGSTLAGP